MDRSISKHSPESDASPRVEKSYTSSVFHALDQWHKKNIFMRQSHLSQFFPGLKCFFLVEISILVDPKQISVVSKNKKQGGGKKKPSVNFHAFFHIHFKIFPLPIFLCFFSIFSVFLASFLQVGQLKFLGEKHQGASASLPPPPGCYTTALDAILIGCLQTLCICILKLSGFVESEWKCCSSPRRSVLKKNTSVIGVLLV